MPDIPFGEACRDPRLLGATPWHPRQLDVIDAVERHQLAAIAAGRRGGKSRISAAAMVHGLLLSDRLDRFVPAHEPRYALGVATAEDQATVLLGLARSLVMASPALRAELVSETGTELVFRGDRILRVLPCNARSIRGRGACVVCFDELGHFLSETEGPAVARRVWEALSPATSQYGAEGRVVVTSTPGEEGGLFESIFLRAQSGELEGAVALTASTVELNPGIDPVFLRTQEAALGADAFAREYGARFVAGGGAYFDSEELRAVTSNRRESLPQDGSRWVCAIDPSSGGGDPFAIVVVGRDARLGCEDRLLVGHVERHLPRRRSRVALSRKTRAERDLWVDMVFDRVAEIAKRFHAGVIGDQHIPGVVVDELRKRGVGSVQIRPWSPETRSQAFQALRARVSTERISLVDDEQLLVELRRVRHRFKSGGPTVEIGRVGDSHGDMALALAAGVAELDRGAGGDGWSIPKDWVQTPDYLGVAWQINGREF